jgi:3-phenylpropionate/cinnamic acid dioxygenase small subunit
MGFSSSRRPPVVDLPTTRTVATNLTLVSSFWQAGAVSDDAIRRVLAAYCQTCDDGRFDEFVALFAPNAVFQAAGYEPVQGRAAIKAFMESGYTPDVRGKHVLGEPLITVDGDTASASTDFVFVGRQGERGWGILTAGRYADELARDASGAWALTRRVISML